MAKDRPKVPSTGRVAMPPGMITAHRHGAYRLQYLKLHTFAAGSLVPPQEAPTALGRRLVGVN